MGDHGTLTPIRSACIDLGSNTIRLLVADHDGSRLRELCSARAFTRLGHDRGPDGAIAPAKVAEAAEEVRRMVALARDQGAARVRVVATAAIRSAPNGAELCAAVAAAAGAEVEVLSGEEEARHAFAGALCAASGTGHDAVGVADVGGGSTELVVGTAEAGVRWSCSLPVGSAVLTERCRGDAQALRAAAAEAFAGVRPPEVVRAFAVGGSATSLLEVLGEPLTPEVLLAEGLPRALAGDLPGLHPLRADLLPAGVVLLAEAARAFGRPLTVAAGGLREGVVLEDLGRGVPTGDDGEGP